MAHHSSVTPVRFAGDDFLGKLPDGAEIAAQAVAALFVGEPVKSGEVAIGDVEMDWMNWRVVSPVAEATDAEFPREDI